MQLLEILMEELHNSTLYIGGDATFGNINGGIKNSTLYIGGNAILLKHINGGVDK